jgi:acyl-CoA synthetase (AMP-forming)/AMP-acid ligase II/NAD-dependent dihydropyrimidine dehydrogenase PreA subunit
MSVSRDIYTLVARRASEKAGKIFITEPDTGRALTFEGLAQSVDALQNALAFYGFHGGEPVMLLFHNGIPAAVAVLGIVSGGGTALPVNPDLTAPELEFPLRHSGARFALAARESADGLRRKFPDGTKMESISKDIALLRLPDERKPETPEETPALLLYTSGTTGRPKGVPLSARNLTSECANIAAAHTLTPDDKALCVLPLHHVNGLVVTLLTPLSVGCGIVMPARFSAGRFWDWTLDHEVSWFSGVPAIFTILLGNPIPEKKKLSCLRFSRSASAALPPVILREFERRTGAPLIESYGISEGGSQIFSNPLPPLQRKAGSVGLPFGNEARIVLPDGTDAPTGVRGEVAVRGDNIVSGYFRNPEATRESFRDGWFFTGDLGRFDEEGYLFLQGRRKELINRAGEMISPREIDDALHLFPGVEQAAAVGVPDGLYGEEVVAFVRMRDGTVPPDAAIRELCGELLGGFKIPKRVYGIDEFPRGPGGKIRRLKLVERYLALPPEEQLPERAATKARGDQKKERRKNMNTSGRHMVSIDFNACKGCGYCGIHCGQKVFERGEAINAMGYVPYRVLRPDACIGCRRCFFVCPDFCLEITEPQYAEAAR